jgi:glutaredoxin
MRIVAALAGFALAFALTHEALAAPEVIMFGASWCGPCRAVKQHFEANRIPFTYRDIDDPKHREAFMQEGPGGIPLVKVGGEKVRGADLVRIRAMLVRAGVAKAEPPPPPGTNVTLYGGHSPEWWQSQFKELRALIAETGQRARDMEKSAQDDVEKAGVQKMKDEQKILDATLDQLESDASNVSLPRKYRE